MPFNPIETSLYVTLKSLTQHQAVLAQIKENGILSQQKLNDSFAQNDHFLQQNILSFTAPPSALNPYQQIIYKFSKGLEHHYLTHPIKAEQIVFDTLSMKQDSDAMVVLRQEQMSFIDYINQFLDFCQRKPVHQGTFHIEKWKRKNILIAQIFDDAKPSITGDEFSEIIDMAHHADDIKNSFSVVNSIYLPK